MFFSTRTPFVPEFSERRTRCPLSSYRPSPFVSVCPIREGLGELSSHPSRREERIRIRFSTRCERGGRVDSTPHWSNPPKDSITNFALSFRTGYHDYCRTRSGSPVRSYTVRLPCRLRQSLDSGDPPPCLSPGVEGDVLGGDSR